MAADVWRSATTLALVFSATVACAGGWSVNQLDWLQGCWQADGGDRGSGERWYSPMTGILLGIGTTRRDGEVVFFELLHVSERDEELILVAVPSGQAPAQFSAVAVADRSVVFENTEHDFPQRISYRRNGNRLLGRAEGSIDGQQRMLEFPFSKISCDEQVQPH
ncbi:MAG: hypothetical protein KJO55_00550 [Gammaproteobacteria bacterium]|nr:hypothetical protein [Gammaproteobacteria bacterium]